MCALSHSCVQLCDAIDCGPPGSSVRELFPSKNTGVGCHFLLQRIFPVQGSNTSPALHTESSPLRHLGSPCFIIVIAFLSCPLLRFLFFIIIIHLYILLWMHVHYTSGMGMLAKSLLGESKEYLVSHCFKHKLSLNILSSKVNIFSLEMNI